MNVRRLFPLVLVGAIVGSLLVPIAIGSPTARVVALVGLAVAAAGCVAGIRRLRVEHADEARPPTTFELLVELVSGSVASLVGVSEFLVVVYFATLAPGSASREEAGWVMPLLAVVAADGLLLAILMATVRFRGREGVEREVHVKATSVGFLVVVLAAGVYGVFEVLTDAPRMSMWWVWSFGIAAWFVSARVIERRAA